MHKIRLGVVESQFADLVWDNAPMTTRELVELCKKEMNWARTTTYTVLKKLCDRGPEHGKQPGHRAGDPSGVLLHPERAVCGG